MGKLAPRRRASAAVAHLTLAVAACAPPAEPPGPSADVVSADAPAPRLKAPPPTGVASASPGEPAREAHLPGQGHRVASIAMRTWIYVAPDDRSAKLGYLRAGAVVDRAELSAGAKGCAGGWYRVEPRGYVCVGKGASLSLDHEVVRAAVRGPDRRAPAPYGYVISRKPPPHLYFRLPSLADQERVEGKALAASIARGALVEAGAPLGQVPELLQSGLVLPKPYGAEVRLKYSVHTGRARESSAYGLVTAFEHTGRRFGLTTELDLIPLDRTRPAPLSAHRGVVVEEEGTPAIVTRYGVARYHRREDGGFQLAGEAERRSGWVLTGANDGHERGRLQTTAGFWIAADHLEIVEPREDPSGYAAAGRKWIDISIGKQMLVAYEGTRPVFATLVSSGRGGMSDPEKTHATVRGKFLIHAKHVSATMDGDDEATEAFDLRDVPYVQYFHEGYALHGAYWHDDFGKPRSHGCINLAPADAAWLFEWTDPVVPESWHGAVTAGGGTLVWIHG